MSLVWQSPKVFGVVFPLTGDSQEVNCPEGAREATLGCASVRTGSE